MDGGWDVALGHSLQTVVGLVLLVAGGTKLRRPKSFVAAVRGYRLLPEALVTPVALMVLAAEVLDGLALVGGMAVIGALPMAAALFGAFALAAVVNLRRGRAVPCGCFGSADEPISSRTAARLGLLLLATLVAAVLRWGADAAPPAVPDLLAEGLDGVERWVAALATAGFLMVAGMWALRAREVAALVGAVRAGRERS